MSDLSGDQAIKLAGCDFLSPFIVAKKGPLKAPKLAGIHCHVWSPKGTSCYFKELNWNIVSKPWLTNFDMPKLFWNIEFVCNNGISESTIYFDFLMVCDVLCFLPILSLHLADFVSFHDYTRCFNWLWHWPSVTSLFSIYPQVQKMRQTQTPLCCDRTCYEVSEALRLCASRRERSIFVAVVAPMCVFSIVKIKANFRIDMSQRLSFNTAPTPTVCILTAAAQPQKTSCCDSGKRARDVHAPTTPCPPHAVA